MKRRLLFVGLALVFASAFGVTFPFSFWKTTSTGSWTPNSISGIQFWYQGNSYDGTTGTATDLTTNGNNGTQSTSGARPAHITAAQNGNDVMRFDGNSDFLNISTPLALTSFTFFCSVKISATFDVEAILSGSIGAPELRVKNSEVLAVEKSLIAEIVAGSTDVIDGNWHTIIVTYDGSVGTIYLDGVSNGTNTSAQTFSNNLAYIGTNLANNYYYGDIMDIGVVNASISSGDRGQLQTYLATRAGL